LQQTTIKKKHWRTERQDNDVVNINGKKQRWKQFKNKFYEDLDDAIVRGEQVKFVEFVLNQGQPNEKLIIWDDRHGFMSEDSENEQTKFNAFYRRFKTERKELHPKLYLQLRPILPFEKVMLH